jgi:hypothetical protein
MCKTSMAISKFNGKYNFKILLLKLTLQLTLNIDLLHLQKL